MTHDKIIALDSYLKQYPMVIHYCDDLVSCAHLSLSSKREMDRVDQCQTGWKDFKVKLG